MENTVSNGAGLGSFAAREVPGIGVVVDGPQEGEINGAVLCRRAQRVVGVAVGPLAQGQTTRRLGHVCGDGARVVGVETVMDNVGQPDEGPVVVVLVKGDAGVVPRLALVGGVGRVAVGQVDLRLDRVEQRGRLPGAEVLNVDLGGVVFVVEKGRDGAGHVADAEAGVVGAVEEAGRAGEDLRAGDVL